jgi:hypothetical protein
MPLRAESRRQHGALVLGRPATRRLEQPRERALTARDDPRHVKPERSIGSSAGCVFISKRGTRRERAVSSVSSVT